MVMLLRDRHASLKSNSRYLYIAMCVPEDLEHYYNVDKYMYIIIIYLHYDHYMYFVSLQLYNTVGRHKVL